MSKNTQIDLLALLSEPQTVSSLAELQEFMQKNPEISHQELSDWSLLLEALKKSELKIPEQDFFSEQAAEILTSIQEEAPFQEFGQLITELETMEGLRDFKAFNDDFFLKQARKIHSAIKTESKSAERMATLLESIELNSIKNKFEEVSSSDFEGPLSQIEADILALKEVPLEDPGDLFFHRQLKNILKQLPQPKPVQKRHWLPWGAFAAAAMLVFVFGISKIKPVDNFASFKWVWYEGVQQLQKANAKLNFQFIDLDDLNGQELEILAKRLSQAVWQGADEDWVEPSSDWDDLSPQEMRKLIKNLEHRLKT